MRRILILGPGSAGKTHLARAVAALTGLPAILDLLARTAEETRGFVLRTDREIDDFVRTVSPRPHAWR